MNPIKWNHWYYY